jgi:hypothetical protein
MYYYKAKQREMSIVLRRTFLVCVGMAALDYPFAVRFIIADGRGGRPNDAKTYFFINWIHVAAPLAKQGNYC